VRFLVLVVALGAFVYVSTHIPVSHAPGILVSGEPSQGASPPLAFEKAGFQIRALATYSGRALVLSKEHYWFDNGAKLSPYDLALGWGVMSDQSVTDQLSMSQGSRFYRYQPAKREWPIPVEDINRNSSNTHMIPANPDAERVLGAVRPGQVVRFSGYLVEATAPGGEKWRSSLTRDDSGSGACELLWLETLEVDR
jgi:hypothetical protein